MNLNSYLEKIANAAIIRDEEKIKIKNSIYTLESRLNENLGDSIKDKFVFGSFSRDTILPRHMDIDSDIDYLVVFKNEEYDSKLFTPQTYLRWLRSFAESRYGSSEIYQSNPTIILSLNHIHIELVPALTSVFSLGYMIPGKDYASWISTDPKAFNEELINVNKKHDNNIRKLIRILKYWNVKNDSPFESYELEQQICRHDFTMTQLIGGVFKDYFMEFVNHFSINLVRSKKQFDAVARAQKILEEVKSLEDKQNQQTSVLAKLLSCYTNPNTKTPVDIIRKLLPPPLSLEFELSKNSS